LLSFSTVFFLLRIDNKHPFVFFKVWVGLAKPWQIYSSETCQI